MRKATRQRTKTAITAIVLGACTAFQHVSGQGYKPDDPAVLNALPHVTRFRAFLPASIDLSAGFPPPGDQGDQGSCVAWSVGYALRSYYDHQRTQTSFAGPASVFSPAFIYNQLTDTPDDCQDGLNMAQALALMKQQGVPSLADFPYDPKSCRRKPDSGTLQQAAPHTIISYQVVGQNGAIHADDVKGQLAAGNPVPVGLDVNPKAISALRGTEIYDRDNQGDTGGHAVVITGYDDRRQAFKFINSWGPTWADHGFGWISYRAFEADVHAAFAINDGAGPVPIPAPSPPPAPPPSAPPSLVSWATTLAATAKGFTCDRLALDTAGGVTLSGWVAKQSDLAALSAVLQAAPQGVSITNDVRLRPWPQCEALLTLSDVVQQTHGLTFDTINHQGTDYAAGDRLTLTLKTPDFPSYLYVMYIEASGDAVPLSTPRGRVPQALPANTSLTIGGGADPRVFKIGPPFGTEMLIAIAAASPLFTDGIPPSSTDREYLTALRKTLEYKPDPSQPDRLVDAAAIAITTHERTP